MASSTGNGDDHDSLTGVPMTSLYTAAARAKESSLAENQRRFNDPLASKLARPIMKTFLEHKVHEGDGEKVTATIAVMHNYILDRTVHFDSAIQKYLVQHPNCQQIVLLGSGMDTRAYRLGLHTDMAVFEIDYPDTHDYKTNVLKVTSIFPSSLSSNLSFADDAPSCRRIVVKADMTKDDWPALLTSLDHDNSDAQSSVVFDRTQPTLWLAEGFLMYIPEAAVEPYLSRIDALSAESSAFIFDGLKSRERLSAFTGKTSFDFMASLASDALTVFSKLGWQVSDAVDQPDANMTFYKMSKGEQKD